MRMIAIALMTCWLSASHAADPVAGFSPGGAETLVAKTIESARQEILVAAYTFTNKRLARALVDATQRGVRVRIVLDKSQVTGQYSAATFLANEGIPVRIDRRHGLMHSKYILIDGRTVQTGSFNYTSAAAKQNAENVVVIENDSELALQYARDWLEHWGHSEAYRARY